MKRNFSWAAPLLPAGILTSLLSERWDAGLLIGDYFALGLWISVKSIRQFSDQQGLKRIKATIMPAAGKKPHF